MDKLEDCLERALSKNFDDHWRMEFLETSVVGNANRNHA